ncbi:hypothetical protein GCM10023215_41310 [Pseudonocardia yuanmonensis]|uniref:Uncharacterized protein n=1 Tax=Pseudonocardia yuanmonensis TaxID=1095914 RepID=A0ABP8X149_9PSEU
MSVCGPLSRRCCCGSLAPVTRLPRVLPPRDAMVRPFGAVRPAVIAAPAPAVGRRCHRPDVQVYRP